MIEMLIVVAIVAILATIAYPSYVGSVRKGRRADAVEIMTRIQQAQERWRANHPAYTGNLSDLNVSVASSYYDVTVVPDSVKSDSIYRITATAKGSQVADTKCAVLNLNMVGGNLQYDSTSGQSCWSK